MTIIQQIPYYTYVSLCVDVILVYLLTLNWILERFATVILIVVVIIFQPELRRFLERVGSTGQLFTLSSSFPELKSTVALQSLIRAIDYLSREKIGAIIEARMSSSRLYGST